MRQFVVTERMAVNAVSVVVLGVLVLTGVRMMQDHPKQLQAAQTKQWRLAISGAQGHLEVAGAWRQEGDCQVLYGGPQAMRVCVPHVAIEITPGTAPAAPPPAPAPAPSPTPDQKGK